MESISDEQMLVSFDIETGGLFDDENPSQRPEVFCAVTVEMFSVGTGEFLFQGRREWIPSPGLEDPSPMSLEQIKQLAEYLCTITWRGGRVFGWNVVGFDMRVLYQHLREDYPTLAAQVKLVALECVDPMFNFFMHKGFPVSLNAVAQVMAKDFVKSGSGGDMISKWEGGTSKDRRAVVAYCVRDTDVAATVLASMQKAGEIKWLTKLGKIGLWRPDDESLISMPLRCSMQLQDPDNSWMSTRGKPLNKNAFIGWTQ